ncbi:phosphotransferase family protein [Rhizobium sp. TRM96647]|uniref:phosphotransferase family protein n=1 Tax=unclassified Rhizobium TaxID=2613769 RepID=UPI0021E8B2F1|nr:MULTISPECIES: phosphotransferase family protein [unclassified Rhizobium]MCV3735807.1 phosphotransferase family protein [Rhizobium sp. TRM96647]MCV3758531.1 phosphotransferase family protein [Rhizobium sp. TRM96650]
MDPAAQETIRSLPFWNGQPEIAVLKGGITNTNYKVVDGGRAYVVRLGDDIPVHQISRQNEVSASRAAHAAGVSPAVIHHQPGVLVLDYVPGRTLHPEDIRSQACLERIVPLLRRCHRETGRHYRGPAMIFWAFHVIEDYAATLAGASSPHAARLEELLAMSRLLEASAGPYDIVFGHNDLLASNVLDDGERLWLIDWDYAGYNTPLFDLGGLASNNDLGEEQEKWLLETYFEQPLTDGLWRRYQAMKCASLLRETLWSMVSELHSTIDFDYTTYSMDNLDRFFRAFAFFMKARP